MVLPILQKGNSSSVLLFFFSWCFSCCCSAREREASAEGGGRAEALVARSSVPAEAFLYWRRQQIHQQLLQECLPSERLHMSSRSPPIAPSRRLFLASICLCSHRSVSQHPKKQRAPCRRRILCPVPDHHLSCPLWLLLPQDVGVLMAFQAGSSLGSCFALLEAEPSQGSRWVWQELEPGARRAQRV